MSAVEIINTGTVYCNPMPHLRSRHGYFPTAVELDNGELLVGFDIGSAFEALDVRSYVSRSSDNGTTWSEPQQIFEPDESAHSISTSCRIGQLNDGTLLGWVAKFDRSNPEMGLVNPDTDGICRTEYATIRSSDGGSTWSALLPVELPTTWNPFEICAPPVQVAESRLLVATSPFRNWQGKISPWGFHGKAFLSDDGGLTWSKLVDVFCDADLEVAAHEQALTRLTDGRLASMCWTLDYRTGKNLANRIAFSKDNGCSFSQQLNSPLKGETCRPLAIEGNRLLVIYRRTDKKGLWAHLAELDGEHWQPLSENLLWDGGAMVRKQNALAGRVAQMSTLQFGCPAVLQRKSGEIFVVFWCVENNISVIRWLSLGIGE